MAKLTLTEKEKAATTWFELSDETVGKMCKAQAGKLLKASEEVDISIEHACCLYLIQSAVDEDFEEIEHNLVNKKYGEWLIVARKVA